MKKLITAQLKDLMTQVSLGEITFSRATELINEHYFNQINDLLKEVELYMSKDNLSDQQYSDLTIKVETYKNLLNKDIKECNKEFKNKVCTCEDFAIKSLCVSPIDCFGCNFLIKTSDSE